MHVVWASGQRTRSQGCAVHLFVVACLEMRIRTLSRVCPSVQTYCPCQERSVRLMWMGAHPAALAGRIPTYMRLRPRCLSLTDCQPGLRRAQRSSCPPPSEHSLNPRLHCLQGKALPALVPPLGTSSAISQTGLLTAPQAHWLLACLCNFPFPPYKHPYPCLLSVLPDSGADPPPQVDCPAQGKPWPITVHVCQHHLAWFLCLQAQSKGGTWETSLFLLGL